VEKIAMDITQKTLTIEEKLELIRSRAVKYRIRRHDLEDAIQEIALYLLEFSLDSTTSNGASESTILIGAIDLRLKQWLRTKQRYQNMVNRCGEMLPSGEELTTDSGIEVCDTSMDVATLKSGLPEFEQRVARMLTEGHTATSIARELGVDRRVTNAAVASIRTQFEEAGLGGEVQE
jgi:hypothetical protein